MNIIRNWTPQDIAIFSTISESELKHFYEPDLGVFIAESPNVCERALLAGYQPEAFLIEERYLTTNSFSILKEYANTPVYIAKEHMEHWIKGYSMTRGMLAIMRRKTLPGVDEICRDKSRIVILEDVMNPSNLGAIFRSAAALGMEAVLLTPSCTDPLYRRSARVSMGCVFQIPWTYMKKSTCHWLDDTGAFLSNMGYKTVSMALRNNTIDINDPALTNVDKLAIIMGTEGEGLSEYTIDHSDYTVKIPMAHGVDSLNVAAASAVAFWELGHTLIQ